MLKILKVSFSLAAEMCGGPARLVLKIDEMVFEAGNPLLEVGSSIGLENSPVNTLWHLANCQQATSNNWLKTEFASPANNF